jgi:hypothetical protein
MEDEVLPIVPHARRRGDARVEALLAEPFGERVEASGVERHVAVLALSHGIMDAGKVVPQPHRVGVEPLAQLGPDPAVGRGDRLAERHPVELPGLPDPHAGKAKPAVFGDLERDRALGRRAPPGEPAEQRPDPGGRGEAGLFRGLRKRMHNDYRRLQLHLWGAPAETLHGVRVRRQERGCPGSSGPCLQAHP